MVHINNNHKPKLTTSEISVLWGAYQNDSLSICTLSYFLNIVEDPDVRQNVEFALSLSEKHVQILMDIFKKEEHPVPAGFSEQDVNINTARLFTDDFMLSYLAQMGAMGLTTYGAALPCSYREDTRSYFTECLKESSELYNRVTETLQKKGILIRSPYLPYIHQVEFVHSNQFLGGWLGHKRPLTSLEISYLFLNLQRNTLAIGMLTGFSQVVQSKAVRQYAVRGAEIAKHHSSVFSKVLSQSDIQTPSTWDITPTRSKESPFSDKLIMFHISALSQSGMGFYGTSLGSSPKKDLATAYSRLMIETGEFAEDGIKLMIKNGWLEKPPTAPDRKELSKG